MRLTTLGLLVDVLSKRLAREKEPTTFFMRISKSRGELLVYLVGAMNGRKILSLGTMNYSGVHKTAYTITRARDLHELYVIRA